MIGKRPNIKEVLNDKDKDMINAYKLVKRTSLPEDDRERNALFKQLNRYNRSNESLTLFYKSAGGTNKKFRQIQGAYQRYNISLYGLEGSSQ